MKVTTWLSQLPTVLVFSLTGASFTLFYFLYKKNEENKETSEKNCIETSRPNLVEFKVSRQLVPAIIGRGGSTVKDIESKTGTKIFFKDDDLQCPDRICLIKGSYASTLLAEQMIKSLIENQPVIETFEILVPQMACGRIMGRGGETIRKIQADTNSKITIEGSFSRDPGLMRRVIIRGTSEQISATLSLIDDKVQEEEEARNQVLESSLSRLPRGRSTPCITETNPANSEFTESTDLLQVKGVGDSMEVYASAMDSPSQFWIQMIGPGSTALNNLVSAMTNYYNTEANREIHGLKKIKSGQKVAAKFSFDKLWYRAEVISAPKDGTCTVYFVDYGDRDEVELEYVLELRTDFLSLRFQAVECSLAKVAPRGGEWSDEACNSFMDLTRLAQWKVLVAKVKGYKRRAQTSKRSHRQGELSIPCLDLYLVNDDGTEINIGNELIEQGHAVACDEFLAGDVPNSTLSTDDSGSCNVTQVVRPVIENVVINTLLEDLPIHEIKEFESKTPPKNENSTQYFRPIKESDSEMPLQDKLNNINGKWIEEIDLVSPETPRGSFAIDENSNTD